MKKIYCKNCKYLAHDSLQSNGYYHCPKVFSWREDAISKIKVFGCPYEINKDNNCEHYQKK